MTPSLRFGNMLGLIALASLALSACFPSGFRLPQSDLLKVVERKSGLIAYIGNDFNIYIADQSGSNPVQVTDNADVEGETYRIYGAPTWSPNSLSVLFAGYEGLASQENVEAAKLFTAKKDGSALAEIFSSPDYLIYYDWSPDSQQVSFLSSTPGSNLALRLVPPTGGDAELLDAGQPFYWTWAPDSRALLAHANGAAADDPSARLSLLTLNGSVSEQSLDYKPALFKAPAYSPDGKNLLVAGETEAGASALILTDALGSNPQTLAEFEANIAFAWSPNSQRVAYIASDRASVGVLGTLMVADPTGQQPTIELEDEQVFAFFWSPDSKLLAYFSPHRVPPPTPEGGGEATGEEQIVWHLGILDAKSGQTRDIATFQPSERFLQLLPYFDQYHHSATIWSPDSQNLVVSAYGPNGPGIFVVAASGNLDPRFIVDGQVGFWSWE